MRQLMTGWVLALGLGFGPPCALAEPPAEPLRQLCATAELVADIDPMVMGAVIKELTPVRVTRRELSTTVHEELRSAVRAEVQRDLARERLAAAPGRARTEGGPPEGRGVAATASEAANQAQQNRRNQDVAAARAREKGHPNSLTRGPGGNALLPRSSAR